MLCGCTRSNNDNISKAVVICYTLLQVFDIYFFHLKLRKILQGKHFDSPTFYYPTQRATMSTSVFLGSLSLLRYLQYSLPTGPGVNHLSMIGPCSFDS